MILLEVSHCLAIRCVLTGPSRENLKALNFASPVINSEVQTFKTLKIDLCSFNGRSWPPFGERKVCV